MKNKQGGAIYATLACMLIAVVYRSDSRSLTAKHQHITCAGMHTGMMQLLLSLIGPGQDRGQHLLLNSTKWRQDREKGKNAHQ